MGGTFHTCCPTAHSHTRGLILSASDGIWNMLFSTCSHTSRWVRFRFGGCLSLVVAHVRPTHHSPFRVLRTSLMPSQPGFVFCVPTWQHVHRRVLREFDIEFEPTRHWSSSFFTACSYHGNSLRLATATRRVMLTLPENANSCSCASSTCALASESHRIACGTWTRQLCAWFQKSRVSPCLRLARLRHGHTSCKHERLHVDTDCL